MTYFASVNIENGLEEGYKYFVTPNVQRVLGDIVSDVQQGAHSFCIIGNYGTGKSSFLMVLEEGLREKQSVLLPNNSVFFGYHDFEILNIVGEYRPLRSVLAEKLSCTDEDVLKRLKKLCNSVESESRGLFLVIDEFGKFLEHAAAENPEEELYFLQQLSELINDHKRKAVLLTTLHQNFGAYSARLSEAQRNEWQKVKGRFKEVVFNEPVEQLLFLAAEQNVGDERKIENERNFRSIYNMAKECHYISDAFQYETAQRTYPLDPLAAQCLTVAIQRYGQNERSLFSFLTARGNMSLYSFVPSEKLTYNLSSVFDYLVYYFYSSISDVNIDSSQWSAVREAITRVENRIIPDLYTEDALKIVKAVGLLNILSSAGTRLTKKDLCTYASLAMDVADPDKVITLLDKAQVIRFAAYKEKFMLFEGTDINIEAEMKRAATIIPVSAASVDQLAEFFHKKVCLANSVYYKKGTPRYFEFVLCNEPEALIPEGDVDGYCELVIPLNSKCEQRVKDLSKTHEEAVLFAVFRNSDKIVKHLHEIQKLRYLISTIALNDKVARTELTNILYFEQECLGNVLNASLFDNSIVAWYYHGRKVSIESQRDLNVTLSRVCEDVYPATPIIRNELFNREKVSSAISLARTNYFDDLLENNAVEDLGIPKDMFPPEKTCYMSLLKETGIHRQDEDGMWVLGEPTSDGVKSLFRAGDEFISSTVDKPRKISELIRLLRTRPFKLKQGLIDFWIPTFLFIKQQDFALYSGNTYISRITKEVIELILRRPADFQIKAFNVEGIRLEFFKKYRQFLQQDADVAVTHKSFARTYEPFLRFYLGLNAYAKSTRKFNSMETLRFRDTLATANDPEKAFFEDIPEALGYHGIVDESEKEFVEGFVQKIRGCVRELNQCYDDLIARIETSVMKEIGLPLDYSEYKPVIEARYATVKKHLLSSKAKQFLDRIMTPCDTSKEFIERIAGIVLDARLESLKDKDEESLIDNIVFLFRELDRYCGISSFDAQDGDKLFGFGLTTSDGINENAVAYRLPQSQMGRAVELENKLDRMLTGNDNLDICVLLQLLEKKIRNNG